MRLKLLAQAGADHLAVVTARVEVDAAADHDPWSWMRAHGALGRISRAPRIRRWEPARRAPARRSAAAWRHRRRRAALSRSTAATPRGRRGFCPRGRSAPAPPPGRVGTAAAASSFFPSRYRSWIRFASASNPSRTATSWWKFARAPHAAEVERVHRAHEVGCLLEVVVDDHRHGRARPRTPRPVARARAREPLRKRVLVEIRSCAAREQRQPAVADLRRERDVLGPSAPRKIGILSRTGCSVDLSGLPSPCRSVGSG